MAAGLGNLLGSLGNLGGNSGGNPGTGGAAPGGGTANPQAQQPGQSNLLGGPLGGSHRQSDPAGALERVAGNPRAEPQPACDADHANAAGLARAPGQTRPRRSRTASR